MSQIIKESREAVELCSKCRLSMTLPTYVLPFQDSSPRGYQIPSTPDALLIESTLHETRIHMRTLSSEIQRVQAILRALEAQHAHVSFYLKATEIYVRPSPIRRLPTEVLELIFASACDSYQRDEYKTPLSISLVCSKWRAIAISNPSLWTHIHVTRESGDICDHYLERGGNRNLPLSMKFDLPVCPEDESEYFEKCLDPLHQQHTAKRWKVVEFRTYEEDFSYLEGLFDALPLLEVLIIALKDELRHFPSAYKNAPSLRKLVMLDRCRAEDCFRDIHDDLPWSSIRHIETDHNATSMLRDLNDKFGEDHSERVLTISSVDPFLSGGGPRLDLHVTSLVLQPGLWWQGFRGFLQFTRISTLVDLTLICPQPDYIRHYMRDWENALEDIGIFLSNGPCQLKRFTFVMHGSYPMSHGAMKVDMAESLAQALESTHMESLESLKIVEAISGPHLLTDELLKQMADQKFLAKLQSLELVWGKTHVPNRELLSEMISSRTGGTDGRGLASVVLGMRNGADLQSEIQSFMGDLRKGGIDARLW